MSVRVRNALVGASAGGTPADEAGRLNARGAVARTEVAWLKWGMRVLFAAVLGVGGVAAQVLLSSRS